MELCNLKQKLLIACHISTWSLSTRIFLDNCNRLRKKNLQEFGYKKKEAFFFEKGANLALSKLFSAKRTSFKYLGVAKHMIPSSQTDCIHNQLTVLTKYTNTTFGIFKKKPEIRCGVKLEWQKRHIENMKAVDIKKSPLCYYALEWFNALMMTMMMNIE